MDNAKEIVDPSSFLNSHKAPENLEEIKTQIRALLVALLS